MEDRRMVLESSFHRGRDRAGVTEHSEGEGRGTEDSTLSAPVGEHGFGLPKGEKVEAENSYPEWHQVRCLGDGGGETASGGNSGGL